MLTLDKLNDDFGLAISEDSLDNLATDIYLEMGDSFEPGFQGSENVIKFVFNKLMTEQMLKDLIRDQLNSEVTDSDSVRQIFYNDQQTKTQLIKGLAKLVANKLRPSVSIREDFEKIFETACAGDGGCSSIESSTPEHTIEVINGQEEKKLQENWTDEDAEFNNMLDDFSHQEDSPFIDEEEIAQEEMWDSIPDPYNYDAVEDPLDRLDDGSFYNLDERLQLRKELNTLREAEEQDDEAIDKVRYKLQKFTNGGTPYIDENGTPQIDGEKNGPSSYEAWRAGINNKKRDARIKQEKEDRETPFASPKTTVQERTLDGQIDNFLLWHLEKYGDI